jgi:hypothetical protein
VSDLDPRSYPLGKPTNRKPEPVARPVLGRPGWWQRPGEEPFYIEPERPEPIL